MSSPSMVKDLTRGPVVPLLMRFTLPLFVSNALQAVYNMVDMIEIGRHTSELQSRI